MFEAKLTEGYILKKIIEAIKDIVNDVNIDVSPSGKSISKIEFDSFPLFLNTHYPCRHLHPGHGHLSRRLGVSQSQYGGI